MAVLHICALVAVVAVATAAPASPPDYNVELRMPDVQPKIADTYLCHPMKTGDKETFITGFIPHGNMSTAHHMLLYGCTVPGDSKDVWNCGEMQSTSSEYDTGPVCSEGAQILYAWAMDAPMLHLPDGVAFKVGGDTSINYLVLQVHYKDVTQFVEPNNHKDSSGFTLIETDTPQPKRAGVYLLGTDGNIPAHSVTYMETACSVEDPITVHPFAYRVHAHTHGEVVAGYRIRNGKWDQIGRQSPKLPQMFYNVSDPDMLIKSGDILAARCTMVNNDDKDVAIGTTQNDEMCNFYMMYYVDGPEIMSEEYCFTQGPPHWYWNDVEVIHAENAPNDVSVVPGTDKILQETMKEIAKTEEEMERMPEIMQDDYERLMDVLGGDLWQGEEDLRGNMIEPASYDLSADEFARLSRGNMQPSLTDDELAEYYNELYGQ